MKITIRIEKIVVEISGEISPSIPDTLPADVKKAAELWQAGATGKEIVKGLGLKGVAPDAGTTYISQLRGKYGADIFPYRTKNAPRKNHTFNNSEEK